MQSIHLKTTAYPLLDIFNLNSTLINMLKLETAIT